MGFGFVKSISKSFQHEVFIPKSATQNAVEGDLVKVNVLGKDAKGFEGEVAQIIERRLKYIGGTVVEVIQQKAYVLAPLLGSEKEIEINLPKKEQLKPGDRILVELDPKQNKKQIKARFKQYIGHINDPLIDSDAAVTEFALREKFPMDVENEVKKLPDEINPADYSDREDLQNLTTFTIDPETAKDYDDAISLEKTPQGHFELGVHIADVSYFVTEGSALDQEAYQRCNSTYFPDRCVSMLPKALADNLCSLKSDVPRLAVSTLMVLDKKGKLLSYRITRSIIKSRQRFSYEQVLDILQKKAKHSLYKKLKELERVALLLKGQRRERGCVDLALADSKMLLDKKGIPKCIEKVEYDITHQMIEEFMLKNNEVIAKHLYDKGVPIPYRIHEEPKSDNINSFIQTAETLGGKLPPQPTQKDLQALFDSVRGTEIEQHLSVHFIKCMKLAFYSPENAGHYGLQLDFYSHFTSPIRRYVDLVIHRQLFDPNPKVSVAEIADRCSNQERLSAKAEKSVRELKMMRYFKQNASSKTYQAIITQIKHFGIFFEIPELLYEGFIHVSGLGRDYYIFDEAKSTFKARGGKSTFQVGKNIKVRLKSLSLIQRELEWTRK